ncbi:uncharacterized protein SAPINGB_P003455 [Magnusiomyces paraingens]|uniref:ATP-dependent helicase IRC3 n=1 Tax=Magnusiomyces paraingens TaxID=2606893 RepID=A0A5E8BPF5_9ASCO|nr:uncharacterized protein SAPINGB_P003455 [Saprochaete ingens]VVT53203.1 unnamed protein product [Saprochaete ingens]
MILLRYLQQSKGCLIRSTIVQPGSRKCTSGLVFIRRLTEPSVGFLNIDSSLTQNSHKISLRSYQNECIKECLESFANGKNRIAVSLATGSGKTVIFSHLLSQITPQPGQGSCVLILVHRRELATQARDTVQRVCPHLKVQIEMGKECADVDADVIVASVPTLTTKSLKRLEYPQFDPKRFKLIIVDEAHHAAAPTYLKILKFFGAGTPETKIYVAGFSATFSRLDGLSLKSAMDHVVYHRSMMEMIKDGFLSDLRLTTIKASYDLQPLLDEENAKWEEQERQRLMTNTLKSPSIRKIKPPSKRGDYNSGLLSKILNTNEINELVVKIWKRICLEKYLSTLIFCVDIKHAEDLATKFQEHNISAEYISSKTPDGERAAILKRFKNRETPVLINCAILTEGTDIPNIDAIMLLRPTRSESLLVQMVGRGLRLHPGKEHCHLIDFVGSTSAQKSGMYTTPTLMGLDPNDLVEDVSLKEIEEMNEEKRKKEREREEREKEEKEKKEKEENIPENVPPGIDVDKIKIETYEGIVDFLGMKPDKNKSKSKKPRLDIFTSPYAWVPIKDNMYVLTGKEKQLNLVLEPNEPDKEDTWRLEKFEVVDQYTYLEHLINEHGNKQGIKKLKDFEKVDSRKKKYTIKQTVAEKLPNKVALRAADSLTEKYFESPYMVQRRAPWRNQPASSAQVDLIKKLLKKTLESREITSLHNKFLKERNKRRGGENTEPETSTPEDNLEWVEDITKGEASDILTKAKNGGLKDLLKSFYSYLNRLNKITKT